MKDTLKYGLIDVVRQGGGEQISCVMYCARERAIAADGRGIADDPIYPEPAALTDNTARKVVELGYQIRERTRLLKSEGLTGRQINDDVAIGRIVEELNTLKAACLTTPRTRGLRYLIMRFPDTRWMQVMTGCVMMSRMPILSSCN